MVRESLYTHADVLQLLLSNPNCYYMIFEFQRRIHAVKLLIITVSFFIIGRSFECLYFVGVKRKLKELETVRPLIIQAIIELSDVGTTRQLSLLLI